MIRTPSERRSSSSHLDHPATSSSLSFPPRASSLVRKRFAVNMARTTTLSDQNQILILGGSYAGVSTAHYLLKHVIPKLSDNKSYEVVMVSTSSQAMCRPACPRALISDNMFPQEKLFVNIPEIFEQYPKSSFRFVHGTATELDHTNRIVYITLATGSTEKIGFQALVIATGASTSSPLLGMNRDGDFLRENWAAFRKALPAARSSKCAALS